MIHYTIIKMSSGKSIRSKFIVIHSTSVDIQLFERPTTGTTMPNDDLEHSGSDQSEENTSVFEDPEEEKDEVGEVRKMSSKDTFRVLMGRYVVTVVLLLTAFAVTFTTYMFLQDQEEENFKTAVSG